MITYLCELMRYMQENGKEDFAHPGVEHKTIDIIVKAIREIVLQRENTPLYLECECEDEWLNTWYWDDYNVDLPNGIRVECAIKYYTLKRSRMVQTADIANSRVCVFQEINELKAYDSMGAPVPIFDAEAFTNLVSDELRVVFEGETAQKSQLQYVSDFSEGLTVVCSRQKVVNVNGYSNPGGKGLNAVTSTDYIYKYTYVNQQGEFAFPDKWFDEAYDFVKGIAKVKTGDRLYYIDRTGNEVKDPSKCEGAIAINAMSNYEKRPFVGDFGKYSEIDSANLPLEWLECEDEDGDDIRCIVSPDGGLHPIEVDIDDKFKLFADKYSEGLLILLGDDPDMMLNPWDDVEPIGCCIDCYGKVRYWFNPCKKLPIYGYSEGYAVFHDFAWWYKPEGDPHYNTDLDYGDHDAYPRFRGYSYVDPYGNVAFDGKQFGVAYPFKDGLARVSLYCRSLFIDTEGRVVF